MEVYKIKCRVLLRYFIFREVRGWLEMVGGFKMMRLSCVVILGLGIFVVNVVGNSIFGILNIFFIFYEYKDLEVVLKVMVRIVNRYEGVIYKGRIKVRGIYCSNG